MKHIKITLSDGIFAVILILIFGMGFVIHSRVVELSAFIQEESVNTMVPDFQTKWTDADGREHTVSTYIGEDGDVTSAAILHKSKVDALQTLYPPK